MLAEALAAMAIVVIARLPGLALPFARETFLRDTILGALISLPVVIAWLSAARIEWGYFLKPMAATEPAV